VALKPLDTLPEHPLKIKRALLSVSDKTGIADLAKVLHKHNVELISTGGTAKAIRDAGIPVTDVSEITGFEECLDGRVKTLHPVIHGGILARTSHQPDADELKRLKIDPIELVVVNLYPFQDTVGKENVTPAIATENIDIGGPTMIRAAAKNFAHAAVLTAPDQYQPL
jgi:phosphoribosylaminoimidazolecarboxamide formyltransferase / IMP cyclohydrolase